MLCVTSSGIASLILTSWTSHSMLGIPIEIYENSVSTIKKNSLKGELLRKTRLVIWEEVPMQHRFASEAIDRTLRDFMDQPDLHFSGITVTFGGDFQQTLSIIPKGTKEQIIGACIQRSQLWRHIKVLHLTENIQVDPNDQ